jgi:prophage tail gpP-like protein
VSKVELFVNGRRYGGWLSASIKRSIKAISGSFDLSVTNSWTPEKKPWFIAPLDECVLKIDDEPVITGIVDSISSSFDASTRTINITGRDKTADLVDCSYVGGALKGLTFLDFIKRAVERFGIEVISEIETGQRREDFTPQQPETVFSFLERAARLRGYLIGTDAEGRILISRLASSRALTALIEGQNILAGSFSFDGTERFSEYIVKGQKRGSDEESGATVAEVMAKATDPDVTRYRPLIIQAEGSSSRQLAQDRARWEAITRAAKSSRITARVKGWRQVPDGPLWKLNQIVAFQSVYFNISQDLLITDVTYQQSDEGTTCELTLERADAYAREPLEEKTSRNKSQDIWKELNAV